MRARVSPHAATCAQMRLRTRHDRGLHRNRSGTPAPRGEEGQHVAEVHHTVAGQILIASGAHAPRGKERSAIAHADDAVTVEVRLAWFRCMAALPLREANGHESTCGGELSTDMERRTAPIVKAGDRTGRAVQSAPE